MLSAIRGTERDSSSHRDAAASLEASCQGDERLEAQRSVLLSLLSAMDRRKCAQSLFSGYAFSGACFQTCPYDRNCPVRSGYEERSVSFSEGLSQLASVNSAPHVRFQQDIEMPRDNVCLERVCDVDEHPIPPVPSKRFWR